MENKSKDNSYKPDWVPENAGDEFAIKIVKGVEGGHDGIPQITPKTAHNIPLKRRSHLNADDYVDGVLNNDRTILARTITLIESNSQSHYETAQEVLKKLLPHTGNSIRVGITGVPGAGKSTLIESIGCNLIQEKNKVAVLAVDPSSSVTRGSILGDKTRMERLSREANCFIRPSPSGGTLGGVTRKSRETILVCEAAGYNIILVETVGVGQSEITVRSMVDFFLLIMIAGAGDELQGIKKGVIEIADALIVNKADGENKAKALMARAEYAHALKYLAPATKGWITKAYTCSAYTNEGVPEIWSLIRDFEKAAKDSGVFFDRRKNQSVEWALTMIEDHLKENFYYSSAIKENLPAIKEKLLHGKILPTTAAENLLKLYYSSR